jgi:hypothetical protein
MLFPWQKRNVGSRGLIQSDCIRTETVQLPINFSDTCTRGPISLRDVWNKNKLTKRELGDENYIRLIVPICIIEPSV